MNDQEKIDAYDKRKLYLRQYARFKYHNDPEYRKKQIANQAYNNTNQKELKRSLSYIRKRIRGISFH